MPILSLLLLLAAAQYVSPLQFRPKGTPGINERIDQLMAGAPRPLEVRFYEAELNEFARQAVREHPECGVTNATVQFFPSNYVSGYGVVNLDGIPACLPQWSSRLARLPLHGRHTFQVDVRFRAEGGALTLHIEKARVDGRYISPALLNLGLRFLTRWKGGRYDFATGAQMPFGIKKLWTQRSAVFLSAL